MKHLQIAVNGFIPRDAINTKRRQKLLEVNQLLQVKYTNYTSVYFLKPDTDWTTLDCWLNFLLQRHYPSPRKQKQKTSTID